MKAPHAITLRSRFSDSKKAYGDIERIHSLEAVFRFEDMVDVMSPLPTTYDVLPIQPFYFSEFGYTDLWNGLYVYPMGYETSARLMQNAVEAEMEKDLTGVKVPTLEDKYVLREADKTYKKIIFLPGSNMLHIIDFNEVERLLHNDDSIMVKPHPIMTIEGLRLLAAKVGFDRIINPKESGIGYLMDCEEAWGTANSEIGMRAALMGIPYKDVTNTQYYPNMTYAPIHRLFREDAGYNKKVILAAISSKNSGLIMPWHSEEEAGERFELFFESAMTLREQYRPMYPRHTPLQFSPNRD